MPSSGLLAIGSYVDRNVDCNICFKHVYMLKHACLIAMEQQARAVSSSGLAQGLVTLQSTPDAVPSRELLLKKACSRAYL